MLCRPRPYLYKSDHQYPGVNGTDLPVAVLYAEIGTKEFNTFHKVLSERAQEGKLIYVLRHFVSVSISTVVSLVFVSCATENFILILYTVNYIIHMNLLKSVPFNILIIFVAPQTDFSPQEPKNERMLLSGYGVELAIKSTEYKAVDDTQVKGIVQCQIAFCLTEWID